MSSDFQHCPDCDEEYVAGIAACVDCGQPLRPGPLPHFEGQGAAHAAAPATAAGPGGALDTRLAELPGLEAHEAVQALIMEKIACRATCRDLEKVYTETKPPQGPLATSLPVTIFVAAEHLTAGEEIIASLQSGDLIGDQWSDTPHPDAVAPDDDEALEAEALPMQPAAPPEPTPDALAPQSSSGRTLMLLLVFAVVAGLILALAR